MNIYIRRKIYRETDRHLNVQLSIHLSTGRERDWYILGMKYRTVIIKMKVGKSLGPNHGTLDQTSLKAHISEENKIHQNTNIVSEIQERQ